MKTIISLLAFSFLLSSQAMASTIGQTNLKPKDIKMLLEQEMKKSYKTKKMLQAKKSDVINLA